MEKGGHIGTDMAMFFATITVVAVSGGLNLHGTGEDTVDRVGAAPFSVVGHSPDLIDITIALPGHFRY